MATEISIADLQRDTGETARQLQYWSDLGVFRPLRHTNKRGRGVQRMYRADPPLHGERAWALIASEMNRWRLPIGVIKDIIDRMRELWGHDGEEPPIGWMKALKDNPIAQALKGYQVLVMIGIKEDEPLAIYKLDVDRPQDAPAIVATFKKGSLGKAELGEWHIHAKRNVSFSDHFFADYSSGHVLNLTRVLRPLSTGRATAE